MGVRQTQVDAKRRKICGGYNSKKGCTEEGRCPRKSRHVCNVIAPDGKACEGRVGHPNHSALECPHVRG